MANHPALLSGLLTSLELMAINLTSQHVNVVTMKECRFFFQKNEENGVLLVFLTDITESVEMFQEYLDILNRRFIELFGSQKGKGKDQPDLPKIHAFDRVVDDLVASWEAAEVGLVDVQIMDVLDIFTHFFNTTLQKLILPEEREKHWEDIQAIFRSNIRKTTALSELNVEKHGVVNYDKINLLKIDYDQMVKILNTILYELLIFIQTLKTPQEYHTLFYTHILPLIKFEMKRLEEYHLITPLVTKIV